MAERLGFYEESVHNMDEQETQEQREETSHLETMFEIEDEKDIDGELIDADIRWVKITKPASEEFADLADIEGKLYTPRKNNNRQLIIFTPGFPGGNAGRFEQRYAKTFTDAGYSFFTIRHNGTSLTNGDTSLEVLNSAQRMAIAKEKSEHHIGGTKEEGYSPVEVVKETIPALLALSKDYDKVHLMGQSMGVAASYQAASRTMSHPEVSSKLGNIVGIAGYVGGAEEKPGDMWDGMKMPMEDLIDYEFGYIQKVDTNAVPTKEKFREEMWKVAELNTHMQVPAHVGNILVFTPEDPLVAGPDKEEENYVSEYGPPSSRKLIIRDESALGEPRPHSMLWIRPENLLRAVQAEVSSHGPHYIKVPKTRQEGLIEKGQLCLR